MKRNRVTTAEKSIALVFFKPPKRENLGTAFWLRLEMVLRNIAMSMFTFLPWHPFCSRRSFIAQPIMFDSGVIVSEMFISVISTEVTYDILFRAGNKSRARSTEMVFCCSIKSKWRPPPAPRSCSLWTSSCVSLTSLSFWHIIFTSCLTKV